jgi:hypothetical protein
MKLAELMELIDKAERLSYIHDAEASLGELHGRLDDDAIRRIRDLPEGAFLDFVREVSELVTGVLALKDSTV